MSACVASGWTSSAPGSPPSRASAKTTSATPSSATMDDRIRLVRYPSTGCSLLTRLALDHHAVQAVGREHLARRVFPLLDLLRAGEHVLRHHDADDTRVVVHEVDELLLQ